MAAKIPILTEVVSLPGDAVAEFRSSARETLIAELQTELAARTFTLTDTIMRRAFAEMEASIFEQIEGRLRRELPELVDAVLREHLNGESTD